MVTTLNFEQVLQRGIPFMVILGEKEVQEGVVQLKDMTKHTQEVRRGTSRSRARQVLFICSDTAHPVKGAIDYKYYLAPHFTRPRERVCYMLRASCVDVSIAGGRGLQEETMCGGRCFHPGIQCRPARNKYFEQGPKRFSSVLTTDHSLTLSCHVRSGRI